MFEKKTFKPQVFELQTLEQQTSKSKRWSNLSNHTYQHDNRQEGNYQKDKPVKKKIS